MPPEPRPFLECLGAADAEVVGAVRGGADAALWRIRWRGEEFALRVLRADQHAAAPRERAAMAAARAAGLPVPAVVASAECQGRPALLIAWCPGETGLDRLRQCPSGIEAVGRLLGQTLAAIHAVPAPIELAGGGGSALLHGDFHPLNVLMDGERVSGVIDWTDARAGEPLTDLGRSLCLMLAVPAPPGLFPPPLSPERRVLAAAFLWGYAATSGIPAASLDPKSLDPVCAAAARDMLPTLEARARENGNGLTPESLETLRAWQEGRHFPEAW